MLRYALLGIPTSGAFYFSFSFLFGRNPVLPFLKIVCYHSSSLSWFPEASFVCAMRGRSRSFLLFFFFSVFFLSSCPSLPFFFVPEGIRAYWWFLRILASYTLPWSSLFFFSLDASLFWASGSSGPFFYSLMGLLYNSFGLSLNFPSGLNLFFLGLFYYDLFQTSTDFNRSTNLSISSNIRALCSLQIKHIRHASTMFQTFEEKVSNQFLHANRRETTIFGIIH